MIVEALRSPIGRRQGSLMTWRPDDLAAHVISELVSRTGVDGNLVEEVLLGCCMQVGEQTLNIARKAALVAGLPPGVSAATIDYQCGSSLKAIQVGATQIEAGINDTVIAGGTESMTRVPLGSAGQTYGAAYGEKLRERYDLVSNGFSAELMAERWKLKREELDQFALQSHRLAATATAEGRFEREIVPTPYHNDGIEQLLDRDEGVRENTGLEKLAALKPAFKAGGMVTAGSSSQISDGVAAVLLMDRERALELDHRPRARIRAQVSVGSDPHLALTGPIDATRMVLKRAKLDLDDIDLVEINEAFAPVVLAWQRDLDADLDRVNVNGGAIALGHPLGCSGARLVTTLLHELERRDLQLGLATMCCNGGLGIAVVIDRDV